MTYRAPVCTAHERGQTSILVLGLAVIAATLAFGVAAVTSAHISRMQLLDAADSAALDAADEGDEALYGHGVGARVPLTDAAVAASAQEYLSTRPLPRRMQSRAVAPGTGAVNGDTAVVRVTGVAQLPFLPPMLDGLGRTVTITVESRARAVVAQQP